MLSGRCCATEPPSRPVLQLDIFIEILLRTPVNRGSLPSTSVLTTRVGSATFERQRSRPIVPTSPSPSASAGSA
jgi:hypothetical protein